MWSQSDIQTFRHDLASWFDGAARDLPWRRSDDPYLIWLSEVVLQQTRVDQGMAYYQAFSDAYPTVNDLAEAPLDDVLRLWEGLGYYARARNFHAGARMIVRERGGILPDSYDAWREVPGVGPYTAAAIASIGLGLAHAVVDGNVIRVLARLFALDDDVATGSTRRQLQTLADALLDPEAPGLHNEAMMELGATVCTPRSPDCPACPVRNHCAARHHPDPTRFPVKRKKAPVPHHDIVVGILTDEQGRVFVQRRPEDGMLGGLWEFPGGKREPGESIPEALVRELQEELGIDVQVGAEVCVINHAYSHFRITLHAHHCQMTAQSGPPRTSLPCEWVGPDRLDELAFPRANRRLVAILQRGSGDALRR